jgi:DUF971 family protein
MTFNSEHWPTEIRLNKEQKTLEVEFDDGNSFVFPAELLRVESPSAEVQGHNPAEKKVIPGRIHVGIISIETIGNYAIKINFDDLHDTGIFSWEFLYEMGQNQQVIWEGYLAAIAASGLSREP